MCGKARYNGCGAFLARADAARLRHAEHRHPVLRHLPNILTIVRIVLVIPLGWTILAGRDNPALLVACAAGASDALDGWLARRFRWQSRLGAWLDPAADKLMLVTAFVCLSMVGAAPWWLTALVVGRDVVIVGGALAYHWRREPLTVAPSMVSKVNTALQIGWVLLALLDRAGWLPLDPARWVWLVAAATLVSGVDYVIRFAVKAHQVKRGQS